MFEWKKKSLSFCAFLSSWSQQRSDPCETFTILTTSLRSVKDKFLRSKPRKVLSTYSNCCLVLSVLLAWHLPLTSHHLCVLPLILSLAFYRPNIKKKTPLAFPSPLSAFPSSHPRSLFIAPSSLSPSLPSSPHLINSSDTVSHWCSHYNAQGASPLHLPVMDFQCFDHLTCHVVLSPPWVASLCKLFRNAWILSVLLYSFHHYSLTRQSSSARPPLASPAALSQNDEDCCCYVTAAHHKTDETQKIYEI